MSDLQCPARVVWVRHGEAQGLPGVLTDRGRDQLAELARQLTDERVAAVWGSTMPRAAESATILAEALGAPLRLDARLREYAVCEEEMPDHGVTPAALQAAYASWLGGDLTPEVYGESGATIVGRLRQVGDDIADLHRGETVVAVAHAGILQTGLQHACGNLEGGFVAAHPLPLAGTVAVDVDGTGWCCRRWAGLELG